MMLEFHNVCAKKRVYRFLVIIGSNVYKYLETHKQRLLDIDYYKIISWYAVIVAKKNA